jgi:WD40 repeat protein
MNGIGPGRLALGLALLAAVVGPAGAQPKLRDTFPGGHTSSVRSVAFSPDGKTVASGAGLHDYHIKLWDVATGQNTATLKADTGWGVVLAFSPDGRLLAGGNGKRLAQALGDNSVQLWDVAGRK